MHLAATPLHTQDWPESERLRNCPGPRSTTFLLQEGLTRVIAYLSLLPSVCLSLALRWSSALFPSLSPPSPAPLSTLDHLHQVDIRRVYSGVCNCILSLVLHYQP